MRLLSCALTVLAAIFLCLPALARSADKRPTPQIQVEVVWTEIYEGKIDIFFLVTNPNDFDVYVGNCGSGKIQQNAKVTVGRGTDCSRQVDFTLLTAKGKRLVQLERGCKLEPGPNHFLVSHSSVIDPKSHLPWNYVVKGEVEFDFVIPNGAAEIR